MKRVAIIGNGGAGKSTLAIALGQQTKLPVHHLDQLIWEANFQPISEEIFIKRHNKLLEKDAWIIEGVGYDSTIEDRIRASDTFIYYGPLTGTHLIMYGVFVGLPFTLAVLLFGFEGVKAIKIIKVGQFPLPGQKVFKPTKYKHGNAARINGAILIAAVMFLFGMAVWGFGQAKEIAQEIKSCEINPSVNKQLHRKNFTVTAFTLRGKTAASKNYSVS